MKIYMYKPLHHSDSIRLIQLSPAEGRLADLHCKLVHQRLEENPKYEAMSYVWGNPTFGEILFSPSGTFRITQSLSSTLRRFRLKDQARMLWADAVCISQVDKDEKARQIPLIGSIYKNASSVLAWLGEGRESARQAVAECKVLASLAKIYHVEPEEYNFKVFTEPKLKLPAASQGSKKLRQDLTGSG